MVEGGDQNPIRWILPTPAVFIPPDRINGYDSPTFNSQHLIQRLLQTPKKSHPFTLKHHNQVNPKYHNSKFLHKINYKRPVIIIKEKLKNYYFIIFINDILI